MNSNRRTRTLLTLATDNWLSRAYLAVVAAATGFFLFDTFFVSHTDASMSGAVPWLLTSGFHELGGPRLDQNCEKYS